MLLERIDSDTNLATLFNAYLERLRHVDISTRPYGSMATFRRLSSKLHSELSEPERREAHCLPGSVWQHYELKLLVNSLHELHFNVLGAITVLTILLEEYDADPVRYAIEGRLKSLAENGYDEDEDDEDDWYQDPDGQWQIRYCDDAESLAGYTLADDLGNRFVGGAWRGESIGSSTASDFAYWTQLVQHANDYNIFDTLTAELGEEVPVYRENERGEYVAQSLGQRTENRLQDERANVRTGSYFNQTLDALTHAATLYARATDAASYGELLTHLTRVRDCLDLHEPATPFND